MGSCDGDSGGPLVKFISSANPPYYIQVGVLHGGVGQCGNSVYPGIYARLEDKEILDFVKTKIGLSMTDYC